MQVKVEEQEERVKTLNDVNNVLREQLDNSRGENVRLETEVENLTVALESSRQEVEILNGQLETKLGAAGGGSGGELLTVWRGLAGIKRLQTDMKLATLRDLAKMKAELSQAGRAASTACLEVYTKSQVVLDAEGKEVAIGSGLELWERAERARLELSLIHI